MNVLLQGLRAGALAPLRSLLCIATLLFGSFVPLSSAVFASDPFCSDYSGSDAYCTGFSDPGTINPNRNGLRHVGNPVDVIYGAKQQREIEFQAAGSALHLSRYYYSDRSDANVGVGAGWRHSYQVALVAVDANHLRIQQASGRWLDFYLIESIVSQSDSDDVKVYMANTVDDGYIVNGQKTIWYLPDDRELHFNGSMLTQVHYPNSSHLKLIYSAGRLSAVRDSDGRELGFEYISRSNQLPDFDALQAGMHPGYLKTVTLPSGEKINYTYDSNSNLVLAKYSYGDNKQYRYDNKIYPNHLSAIQEQRGETSSLRVWQYDEEGRVVSYAAPDPKRSLSIEYSSSTDSEGLGETLVTHASGQQQRYQWLEASADTPSRVVRVLSKGCADCIERQAEPVEAVAQNAQNVLDKARKKMGLTNDTTALNRTLPTLSLPGFENTPVFIPIPNSLDSYIDVSIDGVAHRFVVKLNRFGKVTNIEVGNTSLAEMKDNWGVGLIDRCEFKPFFERSTTSPKPERSCFEDLVYLTSLQLYINDSSAQLTNPYGNETLRSDLGQGPIPLCMVNPFYTCEELERNFELAQLSSCAYLAVTPTCGASWQAVPANVLGLTDKHFIDNSFGSRLFYNAESDEYVLAFRGTDNLGDWADNLGQGTGMATSQYKTSAKLAKIIQEKLPDATLTFTGHSLGGGLATAAALSVESNATVFNPAALNPHTAEKLGLDYDKAVELIDVTTVDGDLLTTIQEPIEGQLIPRRRAPGQHTMIPPPNEQWVAGRLAESSFFARVKGVVLHGIDAVLESVATMLEELCGIIPDRI